ncbi:glycosyl hydrolase family 76 [Anseongella ginsenosidimutans]|uniref:Glycosyl hydrolase family 76 n=1 Tax=Anseongella ginsenosidimutans TaxID=496056 RepID=A0A4R3KMM2_9SPHI|nr:glycosyl hydrolase family 76 [Anseongella ginsenosidimutans]
MLNPAGATDTTGIRSQAGFEDQASFADQEYTEADITEAYNAFNKYLLHPERKLYMRDTEAVTEVGAIWTQAIYWDMAMNAYKKTGSAAHRQLMEDIFKGNYEHYDKFNWDNGKVWFIYDDIMWWVISLARGYELTNNAQYLELAETGFERVWSGSPVVKDGGSYDPVNGGMYWQWNQKNPSAPKAGDGKMACINYPTVIAAMTLYNNTKNPEYLAKAKKIYDWASANLFDKQTGVVADSKHGNGEPHWKMHVYNQGTCIGAAMLLYKNTKEERYLHDAVLAANYVKETMSDRKGILPFGGGEEQGIYTAIFAQYIIRLIEDGNKPEYLPWLRRNINRGWKNRDKSRKLTGKDYKRKVTAAEAVSCYDASGIPALMLVCPPKY